MGRCAALQERVPARYVLCLMLFLGFMVTFLLRVNLNMCVVAMVNRSALARAATAAAASADDTVGLGCHREPDSAGGNRTTDEVAVAATDGEFEWDELRQGIILGSFFWGYLIFQVPGGRVAEVYGAKRVFGAAILLNGLLALLVPAAARAHWALLLGVRALQGLAQTLGCVLQGVQFPSLSAAVSRWVPLPERAKFMSFTVCGASLGTVVSMPMCGAVLAAWGWEAVFYLSGVLALAWTAAWWLLVYETPDTHPRISAREREYLARCLDVRKDKASPVPWKAVFSSWQFWLGCIAAWGNDWGFHTFLTLGPKYIKEALGFDLEKSSWLASLPFLCQYVFATSYGVLADELIKRGHSLIVVRRVSTAISHGCPAVLLVALAFIGCNVTGSVGILTTAVSLIGAFSAGFFQNPLDIAPNFAGSLTGIMNGLGSLTGVISPPVAGAILQNVGVATGWPIIFCVASAMYMLSCLPYVLFATAKIQPWNNSVEWNAEDKPIAMQVQTSKGNIQDADLSEAEKLHPYNA